MNRGHGHFLALRIRFEDAEVGDQSGRPLGGYAELLAVAAAIAVPERGEEVELLHKAAFALIHDDGDLAARGRDFGRATAAWQPHLGLVVGADYRGVEVGVFVDLGAAEKPD